MRRIVFLGLYAAHSTVKGLAFHSGMGGKIQLFSLMAACKLLGKGKQPCADAAAAQLRCV